MKRILEIQETLTNEDKDYRYYESAWYEPFTDDLGRLFRSMQHEYGRCVSKVYQDIGDDAIPCGWYFEKVMPYDDPPRIDPYTGKRLPPETYTRGAWVTYRIRFEAENEEDAYAALDTFDQADLLAIS